MIWILRVERGVGILGWGKNVCNKVKEWEGEYVYGFMGCFNLFIVIFFSNGNIFGNKYFVFFYNILIIEEMLNFVKIVVFF